MIKKLLIITILLASNLVAMDNPFDRAAKEPDNKGKKVDELTQEIQDLTGLLPELQDIIKQQLRKWTLFKTFVLPGTTEFALISNDQQFIVFQSIVYDTDRDIIIWDTKSEGEAEIIEFSQITGGSEVTAMVLSNDNKLLIIGDSYGDIYVFDFSNFELIKKFETITDWAIEDIKISNDNQFIFAPSYQSIAICDLKAGTTLLKNIGDNHVKKLDLSGDNTFLVLGTKNGYIHIYDIKTSKIVRTLKGHTDAIRALAINNDNSLLISGSNDKTVKIWDLKTYKLLKHLKYHNKPVTAVAISNNNQLVASGDVSGDLRIWDLQEQTIKEKYNGIAKILMSPDNQSLISISEGLHHTYIKIWKRLSKEFNEKFEPQEFELTIEQPAEDLPESTEEKKEN